MKKFGPKSKFTFFVLFENDMNVMILYLKLIVNPNFWLTMIEIHINSTLVD